MSEEKGKAGGGIRKSSKVLLLMIVVVVGAVIVRFAFFRPKFLYAGTLEATKVDLSARVASDIATVNVQEGDHVSQDQVLETLTCGDIKVADQLATINYNRTLRLFKAGSASRETMDQIRNKKEDADLRLSWCSVRSPISGIVLNRYHEPGEWVTPGTKLLTLANIRDIWAYIYVPDPEVAKLKVGEKLDGFLPELDHRKFLGKIIKINAEAEFTPKNVQTQAERTRLVFGVKVSFLGSNEQEILKPGMTIEVALPK